MMPRTHLSFRIQLLAARGSRFASGRGISPVIYPSTSAVPKLHHILSFQSCQLSSFRSCRSASFIEVAKSLTWMSSTEGGTGYSCSSSSSRWLLPLRPPDLVGGGG